MTISLSPVIPRHAVELIHRRSLELLERVGIDYKTPRALEVLEKMGCRVDYDRSWASLPPDLVEWALEQSPRVVRLGARDPQRDVVLDGRRSHHTTDSQGSRAADIETGEVAPSTLRDLNRGLLFADALDMIEIVNVMVAANDVPAHVRTVRHFAQAFTQTSKHVRTGVLNAAQVPFIVDMARAAAGEDEFRPIFSTVLCTISPLMHDGPMVEAAIELAKLRVPIMVYPMPLAGGTSPATLAGTILIHNIEFLSGLVLLQAANPGAPVIYGTGASQLDMLTGRYGGSADGHALRLGLREMSRFYSLPVNLWGLSTGSYELDAHYGHQATLTTLLAYLSGADEIYSAGLMGDAQILSLEKMVLDNHLARQLDLTVRPLVVDEERLHADLIEQVGIGGNYLGRRETRTAVRQGYVPPWPPADKTMLEVARTEALEILHNHQPPPMPAGAAAAVEQAVSNADRDLGG